MSNKRYRYELSQGYITLSDALTSNLLHECNVTNFLDIYNAIPVV